MQVPPFTTSPVYNPLSKFVGHRHAQDIRALERRIGYRLQFRHIPKAWIQSCAVFDLSSRWKAVGLNVTGIDYFAVGTVVQGRSTRFDPRAETFHSWIGGYLVRLNERRIYTLQEHLNLAVVDQVNWLRHYGASHPACELTGDGFRSAGKISVSGYNGAVYIGGGYSHGDIGAGTQKMWTYLAAGVLAMAFNANGADPRVRGTNLMSSISAGPYFRIFLKGIIIVVEIQPNMHAVLYGNGVVTCLGLLYQT